MVEAGSTSEITAIPTQEVTNVLGRLKAVLGIREGLNFDPKTGEKLDTPWKQLQTLMGMLEDWNEFDKDFHRKVSPMTRSW